MSAPTDVIVSALEDAIEYRKDKLAFCAYCEKSPAGICRDHEEDDERAGKYETALAGLSGTEKVA